MKLAIILVLCVAFVQSRAISSLSLMKNHKHGKEDPKTEQDALVRYYHWGVPAEKMPQTFVQEYYRLLRYVASADGVFSKLEQGAFVFDARVSGATPEQIQTMLDEDQTHYDAKKAYTNLQKQYPELGKWLVFCSYLVSGADGLGPEEVQAVGEIANAFHVSELDNHNMKFSLEVYYKGKEMYWFYLN